MDEHYSNDELEAAKAEALHNPPAYLDIDTSAYSQIRHEMDDQAIRNKAWQDLYKAMRVCRDQLLEDNGNTRAQNPEDPWPAFMIGQLDELIGNWDPDCSQTELRLAHLFRRAVAARTLRLPD